MNIQFETHGHINSPWVKQETTLENFLGRQNVVLSISNYWHYCFFLRKKYITKHALKFLCILDFLDSQKWWSPEMLGKSVPIQCVKLKHRNG